MNKLLNVRLSFIEAIEAVNEYDNIIGIVNSDRSDVVIRINEGKLVMNEDKNLTIDNILKDNWFIVI